MTPIALSLLLLFVKSLCVFALAGLALLALRRASAAARHLVCLLTLCALLALPLISQFPLSLPVPVPLGGPPAPILGSQKLGDLPSRPLLPKGERAGTNAEPPKSAQPDPSRFGRGGEERARVGSPPAPPLLGAGGRSFLTLWLLGILAASVRPLLGLWGLRRLGQDSTLVTNPAALTLAADCATALGLARVPDLCQGDAPVPMTWGLRRPVVLLPIGADAWPEGRLRAVLLHELAHIRRRDWAAHRLADLACALYWFHPLAWLLARRLRAEGEIACDDLVLSCGIPAPDYARHLLDIARALSSTPAAPAGTVAMARTVHIEGRITQMLNPAQNHRALTRRAIFVSLIAAALGVGTLAMLRPAARAQTATNPVQKLNATKTQPAKSFSEIIGITNPAMPSQGWWDKDGKLIEAPSFSAELNLGDRKISAKPGERPLFIAFHRSPAQNEVVYIYDISGETQNGLTMVETTTNPRRKILTTMQSLSSHFNSGKMSVTAQHMTMGVQFDTSVEGAAFPVSLPHTKVRIGTNSGPWTTTLVLHYYTRGSAPTVTSIDAHYAGAIDLSGGKIKYSLPLKNHGNFYDLRVIAVDRQGQQTLLPAIRTQSNQGLEKTVVSAPHNRPQIREVRIEARPFTWTVYDNVALYPSQH